MKKVHLIGIGGIGISALAQIYRAKGLQVQGSDLQESDITRSLVKKGIKIFKGHQEKNITDDIDLIVYSAAVPQDNPERKKAKEIGIKELTYAAALGELSKDYFLIAVSGTHGKSTTTAMIAGILIKAGFDPTVVVGTKLKELNGSNACIGQSKYLLIEADEYRDSFLNYHPNIAVINNIEEEHPDYFKSLNQILQSFSKYASQVKDLIIANKNDGNVKKAVKNAKCKIKYFASQNLDLSLPGIHNQYNASAALEVARALKIDDKISLDALKKYSGSWRRFEIKGEYNGATIIDDYAHHPTEIKATLEAAKEKYPQKKIVAVFQAHHFERLKALFDDFTKSFALADKVIITDVYEVAGREEDKDISGKDLALKIKKAQFVAFNQLESYLRENIKGDDVVLMIGAGDIFEITEKLINS